MHEIILGLKKFRPIYGQLNFNVAILSNSTTNSAAVIRDDISITLHEITHILGFSSKLYDYYIDPLTKKQLSPKVLE